MTIMTISTTTTIVGKMGMAVVDLLIAGVWGLIGLPGLRSSAGRIGILREVIPSGR